MKRILYLGIAQSFHRMFFSIISKGFRTTYPCNIPPNFRKALKILGFGDGGMQTNQGVCSNHTNPGVRNLRHHLLGRVKIGLKKRPPSHWLNLMGSHLLGPILQFIQNSGGIFPCKWSLKFQIHQPKTTFGELQVWLDLLLLCPKFIARDNLLGVFLAQSLLVQRFLLTDDTVDGSEIGRPPVEVGSLSHYLHFSFASQVVIAGWTIHSIISQLWSVSKQQCSRKLRLLGISMRHRLEWRGTW